MEIVAIAPRVPPAVDGVGDYATTLATGLRQQGSNCQFIAAHGVTGEAPFPTTGLGRLTARHLQELLTGHSTVLLHYVGYGYGRRGCPRWLINGLTRWKVATPQAHLVTMFHEVYAFSPYPWHSAFWLSPVQKHLAWRLARLSDRLVTNREHYADILHSFAPGTPITVLPVLSNVGEVRQPKPLAERSPHLVIFGGRGNRISVYRNCADLLERICQILSIETILDIGPAVPFRDQIPPSSRVSIPIEKLGVRSPQEISTALASCRAGLFNYPAAYLAKSGIFAAYCAHGLLPINAQMGHSELDGIFPGKHYWCPDADPSPVKDWSELEAIASNAHRWYQHHCLDIQVQHFDLALRNSPV
jgi:hypothetical protein